MGEPLKQAVKPPPPRVPLSQAEGSRLREHLSEQEDRLKTAEEDSERKDLRVQELQRLLGGMEQESAALRETIRSREEELGKLRRMREEGREGEKRSVNSRACRGRRNKYLCSKSMRGLSERISWRRRWLFWKRRSTIWTTCWRASKGKSDTWLNRWGPHVATEKANTGFLAAYLCGIHSVFDCLFARLQLQNSRMVIQERDRVIKELEEKVAFLEAEVRCFGVIIQKLFHVDILWSLEEKMRGWRGRRNDRARRGNWKTVNADLWPPVCAEPRDAWSYGVFPGRWEVKLLPFIRAQRPDCLQVMTLLITTSYKRIIWTFEPYFAEVGTRFSSGHHLVRILSVGKRLTPLPFLPAANQSSHPTHPTNRSLSSKSLRSSHETAVAEGGGEAWTPSVHEFTDLADFNFYIYSCVFVPVTSLLLFFFVPEQSTGCQSRLWHHRLYIIAM